MGNFDKIADGAKDFACGLYRQFPRNVIPVISDIQQFWWDGFCGDPPRDPSALPLPPSSPFEGGQCCDSYYDIYGTVNFTGKPDPNREDRLASSNLGKVNGIVVSPVPGAQSILFQLKTTRCNGDVALKDILSVSNTDPLASVKITRVVLVAGNNNCGNPPKEFPPAPPVPPDGYTSPPVPIIINNNNTINVQFNFKPPQPILSPGGFLPPVIINYVDLSIEPKIKIPIEFNFNGTINFGGGGSNFSDDDRKTINNIDNSIKNVNNTTNNIDNSVDNFYKDYRNDKKKDDNDPTVPNPYDPPKEPTAPGRQDESRLAFVQVTLTSIPKNAKIQSGVGAPDVIYAGWFEFLQGDHSFPREYIHYEKNIFIAPVGATGYAYTLYEGYNGNAVAITNKEVS